MDIKSAGMGVISVPVQISTADWVWSDRDTAGMDLLLSWRPDSLCKAQHTQVATTSRQSKCRYCDLSCFHLLQSRWRYHCRPQHTVPAVCQWHAATSSHSQWLLWLLAIHSDNTADKLSVPTVCTVYCRQRVVVSTEQPPSQPGLIGISSHRDVNSATRNSLERIICHSR